MENLVKELHVRNGYYVLLERMVNDNSVKLSLPNKALLNRTVEASVLYKVDDVTAHYSQILKEISSLDSLLPVTLTVPSYAARVIVYADVVFTCISNGYPISLLLPVNKTGVTLDQHHAFQLLDNTLSAEDGVREASFMHIFEKLANGKDCSSLAKSSDVEEGYILLLELFRNGGI